MVLPFSVTCHWDDAANWPLTTSRYCGGAGLYSLTTTQSCASQTGRPSALRTAKIPASAPSLSCSTHQPVESELAVNCCKTRITLAVGSGQWAVGGDGAIWPGGRSAAAFSF